MSLQSLVGRMLYKPFWNINVLPEHRFGLPQLVLHDRDKFPPDEVVQNGYVEYVEDEYRPVPCVFHLEAKELKVTLLQVVDIQLKLANQLLEASLEVEILHPLGRPEPGLVQEPLNDGEGPVALHEVVVDLPQEVPVLDHRRVNALLQDALVEGLAVSPHLVILVEVAHILADVRVDHVGEVGIVRFCVVVVVGWEFVQQHFLLVIEQLVIFGHIDVRFLSFDEGCPVRIYKLLLYQ